VYLQVKQGRCIGVGAGGMMMQVEKGNYGACCDWGTVCLGWSRGSGNGQLEISGYFWLNWLGRQPSIQDGRDRL